MAWQSNFDIMKEKLLNLKKSEKTADVTVFVGPEKIPFKTHKFLLSTFSEFFYLKFYGKMAKKTDEIALPEDNPDYFQVFLSWIYTDNWNIKSVEVAISCLHFADKYLITYMKDIFSDYLEKNICLESVFMIYETACTLQETDDLKSACWKYITNNASKIIQQDNIKNLRLEMMLEIVCEDNLILDSEVDMYDAVVKWGKHQYSDHSLENLRKNLNCLLREIRFLTMTVDEFVGSPCEDGILTENEQLGILKEISGEKFYENYKANQWRKPRKQMASQSSIAIFKQKLLDLMESKEMVDVTVVVGPEKIPFTTHKLFLSMFSYVFYAMFYGEMAEENLEIALPEDNPDAFQVFLSWIYTNAMNIKSMEIAVSCLHFADKYMITNMKQICLEYLKKNICLESVFMIYETACTFQETDDLKSACWKYIIDNASKIIQQDNIQYASYEMMLRIVREDKLILKSEADMYDAVVKWGKHQYWDDSSENLREKLKYLFLQIRFLTMTSDEFVGSPCEDGILTSDEQLGILKEICGIKIYQNDKANQWRKPRNSTEANTININSDYHQHQAKSAWCPAEMAKLAWRPAEIAKSAWRPAEMAKSAWRPADIATSAWGPAEMSRQSWGHKRSPVQISNSADD